MALGLTFSIGALITASAMGAFSRVKNELKGIEDSLSRTNQHRERLSRMTSMHATRSNPAVYAGVRTGSKRIAELNAEIDRLSARKGKIDEVSGAFSSMGKTVGFVVKNASLIGGSLMGVGKPIREAAEFESAMLGVAKQMEGARDASGELTKEFFGMRDSVLQLGRSIPLSYTELASMASAGLRMDIPKERILGFVRTASKMAVAFEAPADQLAEQMGKIGKIYNIPIEHIEGLADTINYLDDNAISKGSDIINVLQRIGGTASMLKMPARDAAALGSTFLTLGDSAEVASTAANALMRELSLAQSQPKKFKSALEKLSQNGKIKGLSAKEIQDGMAKDAKGTILKVLDAINGIEDEGLRMSITTELFGKEYGDNVAKLAGSVHELRRQFELANSEAAKGSMAREFDAQNKSFNAQWQLVKNQFQEVLIIIGNHVLPSATLALHGLRRVGESIASFSKSYEGSIKNLAVALSGMAVAFPVLKIGGAISTVFTAVKGGSSALVFMKKALLGLRLAIAGHPLLIMGTLLAGIGMLIYENWDDVSTSLGSVFAAFDAGYNKVAAAFSESPGLAGLAVLGVTGVAVAALVRLRTVASAFGSSMAGSFGKILSGLKTIGAFLRAHPLFLAVSLLAGAAYLIYKNWEPIKQFFSELWEGVESGFNAFRDWLAPWVDAGIQRFNALRDGIAAVVNWISERIGAVIGLIKQQIDWASSKIESMEKAYSSARMSVSDAIESGINFFAGNERVRADAPVQVQPRQLPPVPQGSRSSVINNNQSTVAINIQQRPGEDVHALARRVAEELRKGRRVQDLSAMYDTPALAY